MSDRSDLSRIETSDGCLLEAEADLPADPVAALVITHPHPLHGGSMHTPVPATLFEAATALGLAAVRFNFRGVGQSTGTHDEGRAERLDVAAVAAALLASAGTDVPLLLGGWSFGADVALAVDHVTVAGSDVAVAGWLAVAAPLGIVPVEELAAGASDSPKHLLVPEHDQFRSPAAAAELTTDWKCTEITEVPGADHFLAGARGRVREGLETLVATIRS